MPRSSSSVVTPIDSADANAFDLQAHCGGRGLMPENTLAAFAPRH
jgi:hypothetical protein